MVDNLGDVVKLLERQGTPVSSTCPFVFVTSKYIQFEKKIQSALRISGQNILTCRVMQISQYNYYRTSKETCSFQITVLIKLHFSLLKQIYIYKWLDSNNVKNDTIKDMEPIHDKSQYSGNIVPVNWTRQNIWMLNDLF